MLTHPVMTLATCLNTKPVTKVMYGITKTVMEVIFHNNEVDNELNKCNGLMDGNTKKSGRDHRTD